MRRRFESFAATVVGEQVSLMFGGSVTEGRPNDAVPLFTAAIGRPMPSYKAVAKIAECIPFIHIPANCRHRKGNRRTPFFQHGSRLLRCRHFLIVAVGIRYGFFCSYIFKVR